MRRYRLLDVCARIEGHETQHKLLREYCRDFQDWEGLLKQAEREGMAPLLRKHLIESGSSYPASVRRSLNLLYKRHQYNASVRSQVLEEVLVLFQQHQLTPIVLKGAALCHTLYPDPALRPMRDMDILLRRDEVVVAQELLRESGFKQSKSPIPQDHYHLPSLLKTVAGVQVCIELHRGLYPNCPPWYPEVDFEKLLATSKPIKVGDIDAVTFSDEEMLHYLYQHAFRAPLTYESYKLINAADVIGFVEIYSEALDWAAIKKGYPLLFNVLPWMSAIAPYDPDEVPERLLSARHKHGDLDPRSFNGWPKKRRKEYKAEGSTLYRALRDTFFPGEWWVRMFYGTITKREYLQCLLWRHPRHVLWWQRLFRVIAAR